VAIFRLASFLFGRLAGVLAGFFYAISAFSIWYGQEVRMYSLALLLIILQTNIALRLTQKNCPWFIWVMLFMTGAAASLTHWYSVFAWPALLIYICSTRISGRRLFGIIVLLAGIATITIVYLLPRLISEHGEMGGVADWKNFAFSFWSFWVGFGAGPSVIDLHTDPIGTVLNFLPEVLTLSLSAFVVFSICVAVLWRYRLNPQILLLVGWFAIGFVGPFLLAIAARKTFNVRYSFVAFPPMTILLAVAASRAKTRSVCVLICSIYSVCQLWSISNYFWKPYYWREDFRAVAQYLKQNSQARGCVLLSFAAKASLSAYGIREWEWFTYPQWKPWNKSLQRAIDIRRSDGSDIWHITGQRWAKREGKIRKYLEKRFRLIAHSKYVGLDLFVYRP
jgi:uncharacterized membrane protein